MKTNSTIRKYEPARTGSVLVGVLWIQVILTVIVVGLLHTTRIDLNASKHNTDKIKAYYLALAGAEKAKAVMYQMRQQRMEENTNHKNDIYQDVPEFQESEFGSGLIRIGYPDPQSTGDSFIYGVIDQERYLNVNVASLEEMQKLPGFDLNIGPMLIDYRDEDSEVTEGGFELADDTLGDEGYSPKNGALLSLAEILLIPGADPQMLYGEDHNFNGYLDANEDDGMLGAPMDDQNGLLSQGWAQYMTVNSGIVQNDARGNSRINVQEAEATALAQIEGINETLANQITQYRGRNEFKSITDLLQVRAMARNERSSNSRNRSRRSGRGNSGGDEDDDDEMQAQGGALISRDLLLSIADQIYVGGEATSKKGCVNINTASSEVLECLPGMTPELADAIIRDRSSSGFFKSIAHLMNVTGMTTEIFKGLEQRVCARSETFVIYSEGRIPSSGVTHKLETIVSVDSGDMTTQSFRNMP